MMHYELQYGKNCNLVGQCTVCLKGLNQCFLKKIPVEGAQRGPGVKKIFQKTLISVLGANSATTQTHFVLLHDLPQRPKSTFFKIFSSLAPGPLRAPSTPKNFNNH